MTNARKMILVTGSKGQLGNEIMVASSIAKDFTFIYTDIHDLDITNEIELSHYFERCTFDFIINCAAYTAVDKAESEPELARKINTIAPGYLAKISKKYNTRLIHISTDFVFDGKSNVPYTEIDTCNPLCVYGKTKYDGEKEIMKFTSDYMIIRTSWLYSLYGNNFVKTMIRYGKERGILNVVFDQCGTPTNAKDLAHAVLQIINISKDGFESGIYHYSNEGVTSWFDFAKYIIKQKNINCIVNPIRTSGFPTPAVRPAYSVMDKSKIKNTFGLKIPYWQDSLDECLEKINE